MKEEAGNRHAEATAFAFHRRPDAEYPSPETWSGDRPRFSRGLSLHVPEASLSA